MATLNNVITNANGSVGIGTSSPTQLLELKKSTGSAIALLNYNDSVKFNINASSGGVGYVGMVSNHDLLFVTNDTERARLTSGGAVGIGSSSPKQKLDIAGAGTGNIALTNTGTTGYSEVIFYEGSSVKAEFWVNGSTQTNYAGANSLNIHQGSNAPIAFYTNGTNERMRIIGDGNIGIGTSSPLVKLHVTGQTYITNIGSSATNELTLNSNGVNYAHFYDFGSSAGLNSIAIGASSAIGTAPTTPIMTWGLSSGNVGIGTSSPTQRLDLSGSLRIRSSGTYSDPSDNAGFINYDSTGGIFTISARSNGGSTYMAFRTSNSGTAGERMRIINDGNVGIGISSPTANLHVYRGAASANVIALKVSDNANTLSYIPYVNGGGYNYSSITGGSALFNSLGSEWWVGTHNGAAIRFTSDKAVAIYNGTNAINFYVSSSGNVGIGTTSPTARLQVSASSGTAIQAIFQASSGVNLGYLGGIQLGNAPSNQNSQIYHNSSGDNTLTFVSSYSAGTTNKFVFSPGGTERVRFQQDGNVGIGTTSPVSKLHVYSGTGTTQIFNQIQLTNIGSSNPGDIVGIGFAAGESTQYGVKGSIGFVRTDNYGRGALTFYTNNTAGTETVSTADERMRIQKDGNVGIGTTSPGTLLYVHGSNPFVRINNSSTGDQGLKISYSNSDSWGLHLLFNPSFAASYIDATYPITSGQPYGDIYFRQNSVGTMTTRMTIKADGGNIGIGTTSPGGVLDIQSSNTGDQLLRTWNTNTAGTGKSILRVANSGNNAQGSQLQFTDTNYYVGTIASDRTNGMMFYVGQQATPLVSERMRIDINGYVGIGTTNTTPYSSLFPGQLVVDSGTSNVDGIFSSTNNTNAAELVLTKRNTTNNFGSLLIQHAGITGDAIAVNYSVNTSTGAGGTNSFKVTTDGNAYFKGNVGIGTTTPSGSLTIQTNGTQLRLQTASGPGSYYATIGSLYNSTHPFSIAVAGNSLTTAEYFGIYADSGGANPRITLLNGNVGIGTTTTTGLLTLNGTYPQLTANNPTTGSGVVIQLKDNGRDAGFMGHSTTTARLQFGSRGSATAHMTINETGNVGIGTTNPGTKLEVVGSIRGGSFPTVTTNSGEAWFGRGSDRTLGSYTLQFGGTSATGTWFEMIDRVWSKVIFAVSGEAPTNSFYLSSAGNVGIGTSTTTNGQVVIYNAAGNTLSLQKSGGGAALIMGSETTNYALIESIVNGGVRFYTGNGTQTEKMRLDAGGNVGIGTTSPSGYAAQLAIETTQTRAITAFNTALADTGTIYGLGLGYALSNYNSAFIGFYKVGAGNTSNRLSFSLFNQNDILNINGAGSVGIGTTSPVTKLDVVGSTRLGLNLSSTHAITGSVNIGGSTYNNSLATDKFEYFGLQPYVEGGSFPSNVLSTSGGNVPTFVTMTGSVCPFSKVSYNTTYYEAIGDYIPVQAGETLYGELWAYRSSGASGTAGALYCGVARYDKDKKMIDSNLGLTYFISSNATVPVTSTWTKYSGTTTLPLTHTPYAGSDGGPVRYVRPYIIVNYPSGTIPTYWAAWKIRKQQLTRDLGSVSVSGSLGIGTNSPATKLHVYDSTTGYRAIRVQSSVGDAGIEFIGSGGNIFSIQQPNGAAGLFFYDRTNTTERMRIDSNGNVGIGSSSPAYKLDVAGSINTSNFMFVSYQYGNAFPLQLTAANFLKANDYYYGMSINSGDANYITGKFLINGGTYKRVELYGYENSIGYIPTVIPGGNVGIGTTAPTSKLNAYASGSGISVFKAEGGNGTLFEVTDTLTGSLFSVNTIAGLPVMEVFSNYRTNIAGPTVISASINTNSNIGSYIVGMGSTTTSQHALNIIGYNQAGGTGYQGFLRVKNDYSSGVNPNKYFRLNSAGGLEILNNAYNVGIMTLSDSGSLALPTAQSRNVTQLRNTGAGLKVGSYGNIFDDGNFHIHSTAPGTNLWLNCSGSGMFVVNGQTGASNGMCVGTSIQSGFVTIVGSKSVANGQPYGYLISSGASSTTGTSPNPYSLTCDSRILCPEFNAVSDERLKNIRGTISLDKAIDFVTKVEPILFTWKEGVDTGLKAGYSAQQTYKAGFEHLIGVVPKEGIPEIIEPDGFLNPKDVQFVMNYEQVTPYHSKVIKHLLEKIEQLEARITQLENK